MSRAAELVVRLAARALPAGIRERHREEWLADLGGSREAGVRASGIAIGALLFSVTVRRDTPDVLGMPLSVAARRYARWSLALLLSAGVLAVGGYLVGADGDEGVLPIAGSVRSACALVLCVAGLIAMWRAAMIASPLAKVAAAILTAAVLSLGAAGSTWWVGVIAVVLGLIGICLGVAVWSSSVDERPAVQEIPVTSPVIARRLPTAVVAALVLAGVLLAALMFTFSAIPFWLAIIVAPVAAAVLGVLYVVRARRTSREPAPRSAWAVVLTMGVLTVLVVAVGGLDLLVWSPLAQAPGYTLDEIWAALPASEVATGIGFAVGWIILWSVAGLLYLTGGIAVLGRRARPATRALASLGLLIVSGAVFFQFWAGFGIGMSIADTLPPYSGAGSVAVSFWYAIVGQAALVGTILLTLSPRPLPTLVAQPA